MSESGMTHGDMSETPYGQCSNLIMNAKEVGTRYAGGWPYLQLAFTHLVGTGQCGVRYFAWVGPVQFME